MTFANSPRRRIPAASALLVAAVFMTGISPASDPIRALDGGTVVEREIGGAAWSDRDYRLTEWPELFDEHRTLLLSSIRETRFEVSREGYVVVLSPLSDQHDQAETLRGAGFSPVEASPFHPYEIRADRLGNPCVAWQRSVKSGDVIEFGYYGLAVWSERELPEDDEPERGPLLSIPTVDLSGETERHSFVARGTEEVYQGHVDTVLLPDGKTVFAAWCLNHAGHLGPLARSDDAGLTWTDPLPVPENWWEVRQTTPTIHRLVDPEGVERLFVFGGYDHPPGRLQQAWSEDGGRTWTPMRDTGLVAECAPKSILAFDDGKRLVMWCDRRDPESDRAENVDPVVWQSESLDGGLTWEPERVVVKAPSRWGQPAVIRSPDGEQLLMLMRNSSRGFGQFATSDDGGETWSEARDLSYELTGHRHAMLYAPDGRLVVVMRDTAADFEGGARQNPTYGHFVAWVGDYDDVVSGRPGQYRIKLFHSHAGRDTGYSGLELLPDGTILATTYVKYAEGPEKHSVVMTRFQLEETDAKLAAGD